MSIEIPPAAYSVDEFCQSHRISRAYFYELMKQGSGPKTMKIGRRRLVSMAAADAWRSQAEAGQSC